MLRARSVKRKPCWMFLPLLLITCLAHGQATQGSIFGTITDLAGAVVPGVNVVITSVERGVSRTTVSSASGEYRVADLDLGLYVVSVESPGFKKAESEKVEITVKAIVRVDIRLQPGEVSQTVQVQGGSPLIRTGSAEVSNVIDNQELQQLPVISRNLLSIASLTAGTGQGNATGRQAVTSGAEIVVTGTPAEGNNFIVDGVSDNMEFEGTIAARPPMDALQEFAVQVSQYSAEFGRGAGGVINMSLKSGANRVHGFAYDYLQNTDLNAQPYNFTGQKQPDLPLHRNQYGVGAGGPIMRNKFFWFFNWEGLRYSTQTLGQFAVPTAAEKTGDFSQAGFNIYDPLTAAPSPTNPSTIVRQQFPGNKIPANRIDPAGSGLMSYYPNPNYTSPTAGVLTNYLQEIPSTQSGDSYVGKADVNFTPADTLSAHYIRQLLHYRGTGLASAVTSTTTSENGTNTGATYTHIFNPRILNEARISYNRFTLPASNNLNTNYIDQYHIPGWSTGTAAIGFPTLAVTNASGIAATREFAWVAIPFKLTENTYQYLDTVSWQIGKHAVKFGVEFDHVRVDEYSARSGGGNITFNGAYTTQTVGGTVSSPRTGAADMILGDVSGFTARYQFSSGNAMRGYRVSEFIQDDWRLTPNLTLNLGLRYDIFAPYHEEHDRLQNFDLASGTVLIPDTARSFTQGAFGFPNGNLPSNWKYVPTSQVYPSTNFGNVAPRLGLAYVINPRITFRGGYGVFYAATEANTFNNAGLAFIDFSPVASISTPFTLSQGLAASGGIANIVSSTAYGPYYQPIHRPSEYSQKYGADIQWSPYAALLFDVGYAGSVSSNFGTTVNANTAPTPGPGALATRQPYPNFGAFSQYVASDRTNYNGLTINATANNLHGLFLKSAFTYSKSLGYDTGVDEVLVTKYNLRYDYGPLDYDIKHRWVTSAVYHLPVPGSWGLLSRSLLGGWETSGIFTAETGFPVTPTDAVTLNVGALGGSGQRPNVVPNVSFYPSNRNINNWFSKAAFQDPAIYTFGNAGKNILRGPALVDLDFALQKRFELPWEGHSVIVRMETMNLFNHPNWGLPAVNFSASNFGIIQTTQINMRIAQAAFRYEF
jgi:Carboxypeptidase regulatory-like domain